MRALLLLLACVFAGGSAAADPSPARSAIALNVGAWNYFSASVATLDLMKRASPWLTQCRACRDLAAPMTAWDTKESDQLDLDAQGWVRSLPRADDPRRSFREVATVITAPGILPSGEYVVRYQGQGQMQYNGSAKLLSQKSRPGRDVVWLDGSSKALFWLTISQLDERNPLRDIRIFAAGGTCEKAPTISVAGAEACRGSGNRFVSHEERASSEVFDPRMLADLRGFRALRFMDTGNTNASTLSTWGRRPLPTDRTWAGPDGVPVEVMLDLARIVAADAWINLPARVDLDYAKQLGLLAKSRLAPGRRLIVEYANEPWNIAFPVADYLLNLGKTLWPSVTPTGSGSERLRHNAYALRSLEACRAVRSVLGPAQFQCVLNTQAALPRAIEAVLACDLAKAKLDIPHCAAEVDAVAIAPYFGHDIGSRAQRPKVEPWYVDPDGGLGRLFDELMPSPGLAVPGQNDVGSLAVSRQWIREAKRLADRYGVALWAYEGGQHLGTFPGDTDQRFLALMFAANRDARMASVYARHIEDWRSAGGQVYAHYSHVGVAKPWGQFGLKESMDDDAAIKWQEVKRQRDRMACWWSGC